MSTILVTGADGFIGTPLCALLASRGHRVRAAVRTRSARRWPAAVTVHVTGDLGAGPDWSTVLAGSDCVIHLAGRAHVTHESAQDPAAVFRQINVEATLELYRASNRAGVQRFVFVSSIGVLGVTSGQQPFDASSPANPTEDYAVSKWQAECELAALAAHGIPELTIVRPTLVCGAGARGNFLRLVGLVLRGLPLPLDSVRGRRNFVGVTNLCDLLEICATHPAAPGRTFLAADPETLTTPQLIRAIADALSLRSRLLPCPPGLLRLFGAMLRRRAEIERLTQSLEVDATCARVELGWKNSRPLHEEIGEMARSAAGR